MARPSASKVARVVCRNLQATRTPPTALLPRMSAAPALMRPVSAYSAPAEPRRFISTTADRRGITPDDKARSTVPESTYVPKTPADISEGAYHTVADEYLDKLLSRLEELQDQREDVDVEYSVPADLTPFDGNPPQEPLLTRG